MSGVPDAGPTVATIFVRPDPVSWPASGMISFLFRRNEFCKRPQSPPLMLIEKIIELQSRYGSSHGCDSMEELRGSSTFLPIDGETPGTTREPQTPVGG
jgi:hypothetical protein